MKLKNKRFIIGATTTIVIFYLLWWVVQIRPWEKEISVTTSFEAFTGPYAGTDILQRRNKKVILSLAITPAPWPNEARIILQAAQSGKIVHVSIPSDGYILRFDISGVSQSGEMMIICDSEQQAKRIISALKI